MNGIEELDFKYLKRLYTLKLVVDSGSIKRAAVRSNVTSSAVSQAISTLEEDLGRKLLLRKKEQIQPTEYGREILRAAEPAFGVCADLQRSLAPSCATAPKIEWLDFAASESLAMCVLPTLINRLRAQIPDIRLKVKTGSSAALTALVRKGELCMALVDENDEIDRKSAIEVSTDRLGFYVANTESASKLGARSLDQLGFGVISAGLYGYSLSVAKVLRALGRAVKPTLTSESFELLRSAAAEGAVVALLPTRVAHQRRGDLVEVPIAPEAIAKSIYKIYLVSEPGCTRQENEFLAHEIKSIICGL